MAVPIQLSRAADAIVRELIDGLTTAVPRLVVGFVFLSLSYVAVRIALSLVRSTLSLVYADDQDLIVNLFATVVGIFL